MSNPLEDPYGAPYPEAVQEFVRSMQSVTHPDDHEELRGELVDAIESVLAARGV